MKRILKALKIGFIAYKNPIVFQKDNINLMSNLFTMIMKVASERRAMMTKLAFIHPEVKEDMEVCTIWCGSGMTASPTDRITLLMEENKALKLEISKLINNDGVKLSYISE